MPITRHSKKRDAILDLVLSAHCHPSAGWVYRRAKETFPGMSLGTVYRNLRQLADEGLIRSVGVIDGQERFDGHIAPHAHFICRQCGAIWDLPDCLPEEVFSSLAKKYGASSTGYELRVYGVCRDCLDHQAI